MPTCIAATAASGDWQMSNWAANAASNVKLAATNTGGLLNNNFALTSTYIGDSTSIGTVANWNYAFQEPNDGDIKIDGRNLQAEIYDADAKHWRKCELKTVQGTEENTVKLEAVFDYSVAEMRAKRNERKVLFEKYKKSLFRIVTSANSIWYNPETFQVHPYGTGGGLTTVPSIGDIVYTIPYDINIPVIGTTTGAAPLTVQSGDLWYDGTNINLATTAGTQALYSA